MEVAASLTQQGVKTTVIKNQLYIWHRFTDAVLTGFFNDYYASKAVSFFSGERVTNIQGKDRASSVMTQSGKEFPCDFVCIGDGIIPSMGLAKEAGLEINNRVVVNEYLQFSHPDIYVAGHVVNYLSPTFDKRCRVERWGHAEYCGQLAGQNMAGAQNTYDLLQRLIR